MINELAEEILNVLETRLEAVLELVEMEEIGGRYPIKNQLALEVIEDSEVELTEDESQQMVSDIVRFVIADLQVRLDAPERDYMFGDIRIMVFSTLRSPLIYFRILDYPDGDREYEISSQVMPDEDDPLANN